MMKYHEIIKRNCEPGDEDNLVDYFTQRLEDDDAGEVYQSASSKRYTT